MGCCSTTPSDLDHLEHSESSDCSSEKVSYVEMNLDGMYEKPQKIAFRAAPDLMNSRLRSTSFSFSCQLSHGEGTSLTNNSTFMSSVAKKLNYRNADGSFGELSNFEYYETCL